jgi:clan AA aspartic protease (TIGR02281 family)
VKNRPNIAVCSALLMLVIGWPAEARKGTSSDWKLTVEAELGHFASESVRLTKQNARTVTSPLSKVSKPDPDSTVSLAASEGQSKKGASPRDADAEKVAKEILRSRGIRVLSRDLALTDETKLNKGLRAIHQVRKKLDRAGKSLATVQGQELALEGVISRLTQQNVRLNAQLANLRSGDATTNNRLVGAINANVGQIQLQQRALQQLGKKLQSAHSAANVAREAYMQAILDLRKLADSISSQYPSKATESGVKAAIDQLNQATGKSYTLTPSRKFQVTLKRIKLLEETVLSESIQLRRSAGGTLLASVVINGKYTQEMIVDSGASLISLPAKVAAACNIQFGANSRAIKLKLADGRKIGGRLASIPMVRVGGFSAENVPCVVLDPEANAASALLGMSFLGRFKFELDARQATLTIAQVSLRRNDRDARRTP